MIPLGNKEGILLRFETYDHMPRHPIAADYTAGRGEAANRFDAANPYFASPGVWEQRAAWLDRGERLSLPRDALCKVLTSYNTIHNNVPEALQAVAKLRDPAALSVVGGQQAGLFTGPKLVIYKAVTLLLTARRCEEQLGRPIVPVFWIAGEDHDWDEANHTYVLSRNNTIERIALSHPDGADGKRTSVSRTALAPEAWEEALDALSEALPDTEFKPGIIEELRRISAASRTLSEAFAKTLSLLLGKHGLVLLDSDDPALRAAEAPMFRELVRNQPELSDALRRGEEAVVEGGYPLQAASSPDGANLFLFHDGERKLLFRREDGFADRKLTLRLSAAELERLAAAEPHLLSNNALTRPIMQEYVLPVLATVLGPSEIAYWSTLKEAFHLFGMRTPVIVPRQEFTLLEGTIQRQMGKFELSFEDAYERLEMCREEWLRTQDKLGLESQFARVKESFADMYRPLVDAAASINPGLRKLGETNMGKILEQVDFLENKALEAMKAQHEAGLRHWERIRLTVQPNGKPQERVYCIFQYMNRYGFRWLDEWIAELSIDFHSEYRPHDVVYL